MKLSENLKKLCNDPLEILSQYKDSGVGVIGYTCTPIPEELIISAELQPYRLSNAGADPSSLAPSFICPFASATLANIIESQEYFQGFILAHTCDPMWRLYDILKKKVNKPLFFLRVPHNTNNELSISFFRKELERLIDFLEDNFKTRINKETLLESIKLCNETRHLLRDIYMTNTDGKYSANAQDRFCMNLASMWMPKPEFNDQIRNIELEGYKNSNDVRLHLNGTTLYDLILLKIIEESNGFVASDDLCTGSRYFWTEVKQNDDPLSALTERYLKRTPCPPQISLEERLEYIEFMIRKFMVKGVITLAEK
ncbi:MAG: 2-hydroxyacyl-CoA dehydratase family protein, partial [Candidatus Bathyarchaeota archaeon]